jgi:farnesyl diphosphate synthase
LRAQLVYAAGELTGAEPGSLDHAAVAVELVHAYSLVHDDLPAMDDDDTRRGRPTVHVAFDEATAILAGDALQVLAFEVLTRIPVAPERVVELLATLARAAGSLGMCGGQQMDMDATAGTLSLDELQTLHGMKTGALIAASVRMGALLGAADDEMRRRLDAFARDLGLAFQIRDDILDVEADSASLGKTAGKDAAQHKSTYPALLGMPGAKDRLAELSEKMLATLAPLGVEANALRAIADFAIARAN